MPAIQYGATVRLRVDFRKVYEAMHRLEYHADIHLLSRVVDSWEGVEIWELRSDVFPAAWEGAWVQAKMKRSRKGFWLFVPTN